MGLRTIRVESGRATTRAVRMSVSQQEDAVSERVGSEASENLSPQAEGGAPGTEAATAGAETDGVEGANDAKVEEDLSALSPRERRRIKKERRLQSMDPVEQEKKREALEDRIMDVMLTSRKRANTARTEGVQVSSLSPLGPQWWAIIVPRNGELPMKDVLDAEIRTNFPEMEPELEFFVPIMPSSRITARGILSTAAEKLAPGNVFVRCTMSQPLFEFVLEIDRVRGFDGRMVGSGKKMGIVPEAVTERTIDDLRARIAEREALVETLQADIAQKIAEKELKKAQKKGQVVSLDESDDEDDEAVEKEIEELESSSEGEEGGEEPVRRRATGRENEREGGINRGLAGLRDMARVERGRGGEDDEASSPSVGATDNGGGVEGRGEIVGWRRRGVASPRTFKNRSEERVVSSGRFVVTRKAGISRAARRSSVWRRAQESDAVDTNDKTDGGDA